MKQNQWEEWESELLSYPVWVRVIIIIFTSIVIVILFWELWLSDITFSVNNLIEQNSKLRHKIQRLNLKKYNIRLSKIENEILQAKTKAQNSRYKLIYLKSQSIKYNFLWFDEERFFNMLREFLAYSVKLGVRVDNIKSLSIADDKKSLEYIDIAKKISITGAGSFANIIKLIYLLESYNTLLEVSRVHIWLDQDKEEVKFELIVKEYGIKR